MDEWQEDLENLFGPTVAPAGDDEEQSQPPKKAIRRRPRRRRRRQPSPQALAARRANLEKARGAPRELIYRPTARRQATSRANLQKAQAARRSPRGNAAARLNALKHGLFAYATVRESVRRLGESPRVFTAHRRRFARLFVPADPEEEYLIERLADACWRRLRLFRAAACWEADRLKQILARAPRREVVDATQSRKRATALVLAFFYTSEAIFREGNKLNSQIEALLRVLLRKRSGGEVEFRLFSPRRDPRRQAEVSEQAGEGVDDLESLDDETSLFRMPVDELLRQFDALPPDIQAKFLPRWRKG